MNSDRPVLVVLWIFLILLVFRAASILIYSTKEDEPQPEVIDFFKESGYTDYQKYLEDLQKGIEYHNKKRIERIYQ